MTHYKKILVFGANGMLGSTLQTLISSDDFLLTDKDVESGIQYCDIRDLTYTSKIVNEYQPDIILNFAALVDLEYCEQEKDDCYLTNTIAAIHIFNLSKDFLFCSTNSACNFLTSNGNWVIYCFLSSISTEESSATLKL